MFFGGDVKVWECIQLKICLCWSFVLMKDLWLGENHHEKSPLVAILRQWITRYGGFFTPNPWKECWFSEKQRLPSLKILLLATKRSKKVSNKNKWVSKWFFSASQAWNNRKETNLNLHVCGCIFSTVAMRCLCLAMKLTTGCKTRRRLQPMTGVRSIWTLLLEQLQQQIRRRTSLLLLLLTMEINLFIICLFKSKTTYDFTLPQKLCHSLLPPSKKRGKLPSGKQT